jgi:hypothetical protein
MRKTMKTSFKPLTVAILSCAALLTAMPAHAGTGTIIYENLPTGLDQSLQSNHNTVGPILADDFVPVYTGTIHK